MAALLPIYCNITFSMQVRLQKAELAASRYKASSRFGYRRSVKSTKDSKVRPYMTLAMGRGYHSWVSVIEIGEKGSTNMKLMRTSCVNRF